jgi:glutathione S-transferase
MPHDIIFHNYPTSPFSEKVRLIFGMKNLPWKNVEIPNMMPKPDLLPLTGGYRKTPVMQIGADIFCDSQIIIRELERRHPEPSVMAGNDGIAYPIGFWADRVFFQPTVAVIFGTIGDQVPQAFIEDRIKMAPDRPFNTEQMKAAVPMMKEQWRAHAAMVAAQFDDGRSFVLGERPTASDVHCCMNFWFLKNALPPIAEQLTKEFPRIVAWMDRVKHIGHGKPTAMSSKEALAIAKEAKPEPGRAQDPNEPNGLKPGDRVSVMADDYGRDAIQGEIVFTSAHEIAIRRSDPQVGEVVVHFPRAGFWVRPG